LETALKWKCKVKEKEMTDAFELVIKGGNVVDGTGSAYFKKDIGISGGKIKKIGIISAPAGKIVDAKGMVVSPGFIDPHGHSDRTILAFPNCESFIMQGITTAVVGNCGVSLAPINPADLFMSPETTAHLRRLRNLPASSTDTVASIPVI
jgi:N-acyl-D-aspartate/D-glutamate deacylase